MLKTKTVLEATVNDKIACMECPPNMSLGELFDALCIMRGFIIDRMKDAQKQDIDRCCDVGACDAASQG